MIFGRPNTELEQRLSALEDFAVETAVALVRSSPYPIELIARIRRGIREHAAAGLPDDRALTGNEIADALGGSARAVALLDEVERRIMSPTEG